MDINFNEFKGLTHSHMRINKSLKKHLQQLRLDFDLDSANDAIVLLLKRLDYLEENFPAEYRDMTNEVLTV